MAIDLLSTNQSCEKILQQVRASNLHFILQESPYSLYLTVRKRFFTNVPRTQVCNESDAILKKKISELEATNSELENYLEEKEGRMVHRSLHRYTDAKQKDLY